MVLAVIVISFVILTSFALGCCVVVWEERKNDTVRQVLKQFQKLKLMM